MENIKLIPIEQLHPHPENPRKDLGDLTELADSIKANGVFQNLTVVPQEGEEPGSWDGKSYRVIIGHRRMAASKLAGLTELPCVVVEMTEAEQVKTMLMENMQRSDLTVYEQAQGFQLMLDMGGTVESVAQDTGFSQTTVRRRVKMMELDQQKLKEVADDADRQIRLEDFDELAKIEDIDARNKVLADIGTNNFKSYVKTAINHQENERCKPLVMEWLKQVKAKKLKREETWGSKYTSVSDAYWVGFRDWEKDKMPDVSKIEGGLFYYVEGDHFTLYTKTQKAPKEKKSKAQLEKERKIREAWKVVDDASKTAYELRKAFVDGVTMGTKNKVDVLTGAVYASMIETISYNSGSRDDACAVLGVDCSGYDPERMIKAAEAYGKVKPQDMPKLVYAFFGDSAKRNYTGSGARTAYPEFDRNAVLELLYKWLCSLGYQMSDEETAMMNGTHEVYHRGEAAK